MQIPRLHWYQESPRMAQPSALFQALLCPWVGLLPTGLCFRSLEMAPQFFYGDPTRFLQTHAPQGVTQTRWSESTPGAFRTWPSHLGYINHCKEFNRSQHMANFKTINFI